MRASNYIAILGFIFLVKNSFGQGNCENYKLKGDSVRYKACKKCEEAEGFYQFHIEFHKIFDKAIAIDPSYAYPYQEKSVAYLKSPLLPPV